MGTPDLLPCPFCGASDVLVDDDPAFATIYCENCGAKGAPSLDHNEAAEAWNRRSDRAGLIAGLRTAREMWWPHHHSRSRDVALAELDAGGLGSVTLEFSDFVKISIAINLARAEARKAALEEAAAYHDRRAEECAHHRSRLKRYSEDAEEVRAWREFKTREDWHRTSATAIRALIEKEG